MNGPPFLERLRRLAIVLRLTTCVLLGIVTMQATQASEQLPSSLRKVIAANKISRDSVSLIVQGINEQSPLLSVNAERPRNPASSIKLLTTFVALQVLGPAYTWQTKLYANGPVVDGVLRGDLLIKGHGDPYLVTEEFWKMLGELRAAGVRDIQGDLVFDDTYFVVPERDPGAFDQQPYRLYNVLPSATLVNFKAVEFLFAPARDGKSVDIRAIPELPNLSITNKLSIKKGRCRGYNFGIKMEVPDPQTADNVVFSGAFPSACRSHSMHRSVLQPATYAFGTFQRLWRHWGGTIAGTVRQGSVPSKQLPLVEWRSRALGEIVRGVNKWSNNVMTRSLLYSLASAKYDPPYKRQQGIEVIVDYLRESGIGIDNLIIENGAGLARGSRISATLMTALLRHAYHEPFMPEFIASMSISGLDGTMRRRFRGRPEAGRMHLKTGRLDGVAAIAGYVNAASGKMYTVALLINQANVHRGPGIAIQDAVLKWVYKQ